MLRRAIRPIRAIQCRSSRSMAAARTVTLRSTVRTVRAEYASSARHRNCAAVEATAAVHRAKVQGGLLLGVRWGLSDMKNRSQVLKTRTATLLSGTMALIVGSISGAWAADIGPIAPPPIYQGWYFTGDLDVGGRVFIQRPPTGFGFNSQGNFL